MKESQRGAVVFWWLRDKWWGWWTR